MTPITLNEALSDYYDTRFGKYSKNTKRHHVSALEMWRTWVTQETQPNVYIKDIDDRTMVRYFNRLRPPHREPASFNNSRQYLIQFWAFCKGEGWILVDPMRHVDRETPIKYPRLHLTPDEVQEMMETCDDTLVGQRDRFGLALGINTAMRSQDITDLTIGSISLADNMLTARIRKTKDAMRIPVTTELRAETFRWFEAYAKAMQLDSIHGLMNNWKLLPALRGQSLPSHHGFITVIKPFDTYRHPQECVQRALVRIGHSPHKEGFHTMRRSAGQIVNDLAVADGIADPLGVVQALLGHKNRSTTEGYLDINVDKERRNLMMQGKSILGRAAEVHREKNAAIDQAGQSTTERYIELEEKRRHA